MRSRLPDGFNVHAYMLLNPDLEPLGLDPEEHFIQTGKDEGRRYRFSYGRDGLFTVHNNAFSSEPAFLSAYERGKKAVGRDYYWQWRVHVALWAARVCNRLSGDFVECGVNRGFLSSAIMHDLDWNTQDRTFWLLDTFSGLDLEGASAADTNPNAKAHNEKMLESGFYVQGVEGVRENFSEWKNVNIVVGAVPATLSQIDSKEIAFASIDMNTAPPEVAAMEFLWPRLVTGAMVLLDDYAYYGYEAQHEAINKFATEKDCQVLSLPTGQGLVVKSPDKRGSSAASEATSRP